MIVAKKDKKNLKEVLDNLSKKYDSISIANKTEPIDKVISTGSIGLDIKTGIGGIPVSVTLDKNGELCKKAGKIIEIIGDGSAGKSTLSLHIIANAQKEGITVLLMDSENCFDKFYAENIGVDSSKLIIIRLDDSGGEGAYTKMQELVETGEIGLVVIDSYNGFQPLKILEDGLDSANMGLHSRLMSKLCAKANSWGTEYGTTFLFLGQLRTNIGQMHGDPSITQGGRGLEFYAHMRMKASRSTTIENSIFEGNSSKGERLGNLHKIKIFKNKMGSPFREAEYNITYGIGIDKIDEIIKLGKEYEILTKRSPYITYNNKKYDDVKFYELVKNDENFYNELRDKILNHSISNKEKTEIPISEKLKYVSNIIVNEIIEEEK